MQTIPNLSSSKSEFEVPLLVSAYRKNNTASAQVKDKEDHFTSGAFDSLQEMQQKQPVVQAAADYQPITDHSIQNDAKLAAIPPKLQRFLQELNITEQELILAGVDIAVLDVLINRSFGNKILRWLALESLVVKILQYPFLDERGIQNTVIVPKTQGCCNRIIEYGSTRLWPKSSSIPFKSEAILRRVYGISEFFAGTESFVNRVWSLLLLTFLGNDLYFYYALPDERYDTTLMTIFFTQAQNEQTLSSSLTSNYVWPELLVLPIAWGLFKAIRSRYYVANFSEGNREDNIKKLLLFFEGYNPSLIKDVLLWLSPINPLGSHLEFMQRTLLWDNRLQPEIRLALFSALKSFIQHTSKLTQLNGIALLNMLADSIANTDFLRMQRNGVDKVTLLSFLTIKTESLNELQRFAAAYRLNPKTDDSYYARYIKPLARYLMANYALWCLGQPQSTLLQPLFWSWKLGKLYVQFKFLYTIVSGISTIIQRYLDKKACESQGKRWLYMDQVADYVCSVCGDFNVFYKNIFSMQSCLDDFLRRPQKDFNETMRLLERIQPTDNITILDFSHQISIGAYGACQVSEIFPILQIRELSFSSIRNNIGNYGTECLAKALPRSALQTLDLSFNSIDDISFLAQALPSSQLQSLNLHGNQIVNISALAQALPSSQLQSMDLSSNLIIDISSLAQALPSSQLQSMDLSDNNLIIAQII